MEFEEAHNNLCAIRLLYRLLEDNTSHNNKISENVIERAQVLLKSLLDAAVEIVFETHLKITATQACMKSETLSGLGEEKDMVQQMRNQSNEKGIFPNIESDDNHEQQHSGEHVKELQTFDAKAGKANEDECISLRNDIRVAECDSSTVRLGESLEQKDDLSDELVNAMKRIESRILAFQLCSNFGSPEIQRKDKAAGSHLCCRKSLQHKSSCKGKNLISANAFETPVVTRNESLSQNRLHANTESAKSDYISKHIGTQMVSGEQELRRGTSTQPSAQSISVIDRVKSLNRLVSGNANLGSEASDCIQGLRVVSSQEDVAKKKPSMFACQPKANQNQKGRNCESSHTHKLAKSTSGHRETPLPYQMVIKPTLSDQRSSEIKVNSHQHKSRPVLGRRGTHKTARVELQKTRAQSEAHESNESSSIHSSSSQWNSQQDSTNSSISDSESEHSSLPISTRRPASGWIVNPAYEGSSKDSSNSTQGSTPRWVVNAAYEGSSEESSNSYICKDDSPSRIVGSLNSYRHNRRRSPKKTNEGIKRLQSKAGLIFHHQHHHHHHHHDDGNEGNGHSMRNNLRHVFHHKNKHGILTNKKTEKTGKGAITRVMPQSNQVGQFNRLAEGLGRHIQHSKNPKPSKHGKVKGSRITPYDGHGQKKLHLWKILRRQRGVKLKNRGRVKMRFIKAKTLRN